MPPPSMTGNDYVRFSTDWKIKWASFNGIKRSKPLKKYFNTSYDNAVIQWKAKLGISKNGTVFNDNKVQFILHYIGGPLEKFKDMEYSIAVVKPDRSTRVIGSTPSHEAKLGIGYGRKDFMDKDATNIQTKYFLSNVELVFRIVLKIPISAFTLIQQFPTTTPPQWMIDLHEVVEDPEKSIFSNAKLISRDKTVFYCNKIIGYQSKRLETMFNRPPVEGKPENDYEFPDMGTKSMRAFIKFLYTGQAILGHLSIDQVIELADTARKCDLKSLKEACSFEMWQKVVKVPGLCFKIIQFSDLDDDLKYLKDRAMDVLVENYDDLAVNKKDLMREFLDRVHWKKLRQEFIQFQSRRLLPSYNW